MMRRPVTFFLLLSACGCGAASAPEVHSATNGDGSSTPKGSILPYAENVLDLTDAPVVALDGGRVTVDGVPAGSVDAIEASHRITRIDPLFDLLKAKRDRWKTEHPNMPFPGVDVLRIDPSVKAVVVKSIFQTAAFAGYPNGSFMVKRIGASEPSAVGRLVADAQVPGPSRIGEPEEGEKVLHVEVAKEKFLLVWKQAGAVVATVDVPRKEVRTRVGDADAVRFPELASKITKEWNEHGQHREPTDKRWDRAAVHVPDDAEHKDLVAVIDALYAPKRLLDVGGKAERVPAFNVTFALSTVAGSGGPSAVGGRLAPESIQAVVRSGFRKFRVCYEKGLAKDAALKGRVAIAFVIEPDGSVSKAEDTRPAGALPDPDVGSCIAAAFRTLQFPKPEGGTVNVVYPIIFNPGE